MLTGRILQPGGSLEDGLSSDIPPAFIKCMIRMLEEKPTKRYKCGKELLEEMRNLTAKDVKAKKNSDATIEPPEIEIKSYGEKTCGIKEGICPEEAIKKARELIQNEPTQKNYAMGGLILAASGLHRQATEYLKKAVELDKNDAHSWYNLGLAYKNLGCIKESNMSLLKALDLCFDFVEILENDENTPEVQAKIENRKKEREAKWDANFKKMENAIISLIGQSNSERKTLNITFLGYNIEQGSSGPNIILQGESEGVPFNAVFIFPHNTLESCRLIMPYYPEGPDLFEKNRLRIEDHFGYILLENHSSKGLVLFTSEILYEKVNPLFLFKWILRSLLFHESVDAFLKGEDYWEVDVEE